MAATTQADPHTDPGSTGQDGTASTPREPKRPRRRPRGEPARSAAADEATEPAVEPTEPSVPDDAAEHAIEPTDDAEPAPTEAADGGTAEPRRALPWLALAVATLIAVGAVGAGGYVFLTSNDEVRDLRAELTQAQNELRAATASSTASSARVAELRSTIEALRIQLAELRDAKIQTVVETKTVTETVPRWVPNGKGVEVELTGFEGQVEIHDVQLTHAYGYSDFVGIAVNRSGQTVSYAQLSCTFLDADGKILANEIVNRQDWAPGQSWGFDCSGQVDATGGIVRVDEMS